jgi:hypothetical protein
MERLDRLARSTRDLSSVGWSRRRQTPARCTSDKADTVEARITSFTLS